MKKQKVRCGDANRGGNIAFSFKGGCDKELNMEDAYRCTGCGGWFHRECIFDHFESEDHSDFPRNSLKKIKESLEDDIENFRMSDRLKLIEIAKKGLEREKVGKTFNLPKQKTDDKNN